MPELTAMPSFPSWRIWWRTMRCFWWSLRTGICLFR